MERLVVTCADVQVMLGCGRRKAYAVMNAVKQRNNKQKLRYVTAQEFCEYTGLNLDLVLKQLE